MDQVTCQLRDLQPDDRGSQASKLLWAALILWGGGLGLIGGGILLFWKAKYQIDYQGNVVEVFHSWPKKQLLVNGELQGENTDFSFGRVELHGRIKSGEATGHQILSLCLRRSAHRLRFVL